MTDLSDALDVSTARVRDLRKHVRGNEHATRMSPVRQLFTFVRYGFARSRECLPYFKIEVGEAVVADRTKPPTTSAPSN